MFPQLLHLQKQAAESKKTLDAEDRQRCVKVMEMLVSHPKASAFVRIAPQQQQVKPEVIL
jgi:hypothetical protein